MKLKGLPLVALIALWLLWGYSWIFLKIGLLDSGALSFAAHRTLLGALFLLLAMAITGRRIAPERVWEIVTLGLVQTTGFVGMSNTALVEGDAGRTAVLIFTMPFWTLLIASPLLGERIGRIQGVATLIAGLGLIAIVQPWDPSGSLTSKLLAICGGATWAASVILIKRIQARAPIDPVSLTAWQMLIGSLGLYLAAFAIGEPQTVWSQRFLLCLAITGIVSTGIGWLLWTYVLEHSAAGLAGLGSLAIPVIAILSSALHLGERPQALEIAGIASIIAALAVLGMRELRSQRALEQPEPLSPKQ